MALLQKNAFKIITVFSNNVAQSAKKICRRLQHPNNPQTVDELEQYISAVYQNISTEMFSQASVDFVLRMRYVDCPERRLF